MLRLVSETKRKRIAQAALERGITAVLRRQGVQNIGFPGGNVDEVLYSDGQGRLWAAFSPPSSRIPRYWNAFGIYESKRPSQTPTVEINIAINNNTGQVAGFFAENVDTGSIFLMHSGRIGGGRVGVGKSAFLVWSKTKLLDVVDDAGQIRSGIPVARLDERDLTERIWKFVGVVQGFKDEAARGGLETAEFKRRVDEYERYNKEYSGKKRGVHPGGSFEYVTYHGDVVQKLYDDRVARKSNDEEVFNSRLMDLYVLKGGLLSEVFEVKTGLDRQMLYTAIGQLVTHGTNNGRRVRKILVLPDAEAIPHDFGAAIAALGIDVQRFKLVGPAHKRAVELA
jgi:hypothetical protein